MSVFIARGTLNQPDVAYRDKVSRRENYISYAENKPSVNHDFPAPQKISFFVQNVILSLKPNEEKSYLPTCKLNGYMFQMAPDSMDKYQQYEFMKKQIPIYLEPHECDAIKKIICTLLDC